MRFRDLISAIKPIGRDSQVRERNKLTTARILGTVRAILEIAKTTLN